MQLEVQFDSSVTSSTKIANYIQIILNKTVTTKCQVNTTTIIVHIKNGDLTSDLKKIQEELDAHKAQNIFFDRQFTFKLVQYKSRQIK